MKRIRAYLRFFIVTGMAFAALTQSHGLYAQEKTIIVDFAKDPLARRPEGFLSFGGGGGEAGKWVVIEDETSPAGKRVVAQTSSWDKRTNHYAILVYKHGNIRNLDAACRVRINGKSEEASAGLVVRFQNENNYFVFEASSGNGALSFYEITDGDRRMISRVLARVTPEDWHEIRIKCDEFQCECYFDGKLIFTPNLSRFWRGNVALWTRGDTQARFTGLSIKVYEETGMLDKVKNTLFAN